MRTLRLCSGLAVLLLWLAGAGAVRAEAPATLVLATLRQVHQLILQEYLAPPSSEGLTRAAWQGARAAADDFPPVGTDWEAFERAFLQLDPARAPVAGEAALRGMVDSLGDPYSTLVTAAQRRFEENTSRGGSFSGIGVELAWRDGVTVVACLEGSPAREAGLQPGDRILEVDGRKLQGMTFYGAGNLLLGPVGSPCRISLQRQGQPLQVSVTRRSLRLPPLTARLLSPGLGYLRIGYFGPDTAGQAAQELSHLQQQGATRLVLDLRGNPGGDYQQGLKVAGLFATGPLLLEETRGGKRQQLVSRSQPRWQGPVAVLVDGGSASAAEIVGECLQGRPRVKLVGSTTFGKARVQSFYGLPGGGGLHLTTARYLSLSGVDLNGRGLKPDLPVASGQDALKIARAVVADL